MDIMDIEILEDGKISIKTSEISAKNHINADQLLEEIEAAMGGERVTEKNKEVKAHHHHHHHVKA
jgi:hypothetical protein